MTAYHYLCANKAFQGIITINHTNQKLFLAHPVYLKSRLCKSVVAKVDEKEKSQGTLKTKKIEVFDYRGKDIFPDWPDFMDKIQN